MGLILFIERITSNLMTEGTLTTEPVHMNSLICSDKRNQIHSRAAFRQVRVHGVRKQNLRLKQQFLWRGGCFHLDRFLVSRTVMREGGWWF
jgi:hypothetical protein